MPRINHSQRQSARLLGDRFYSSGKACKRGHICLRWTSTGACCSCNEEDRIKSNQRARDLYHANKTRYDSGSQKWQRDHPLERYLSGLKSSAKKRGIEFALTIQDLPPIPNQCPILGIPLIFGRNRGVFYIGKDKCRSPTDGNLLSLDRIDNTKGYVKGNVVFVSLRANMLKSDATLEELKKLVCFYEQLLPSSING